MKSEHQLTLRAAFLFFLPLKKKKKKTPRGLSTTVSELKRLISCFRKPSSKEQETLLHTDFSLPRGSAFGLEITQRGPQFVPVTEDDQLFLQLKRTHSRETGSQSKAVLLEFPYC